MAQVAGSQDEENRLKLVAWMDVVDSDKHTSGLSVSNRDRK
jgi:hypothetical protein